MIQNREVIYRELIENALKRNYSSTQLLLSKKFGFSLSTVNNALRPLVEIGAIYKKERGFKIMDAKKLLLYWASVRRMSRDVLYKTNVGMPVMNIESSLPPLCTLTAFSGYRITFNDAPADYSEVYVYCKEETIAEVRKRFPQKKGNENLIVLEPDNFLEGRTAPLSQIYADLWNIKEWYSKDFLDALEGRMKLW
ncbi:winged helix-turn-helix domain-containing protein [Candidatus Woesearchaeota archaeon]|nr:winged helix-turn-helix domain-containing protein [Candidatus Woesearchaeota archaeon]